MEPGALPSPQACFCGLGRVRGDLRNKKTAMCFGMIAIGAISALFAFAGRSLYCGAAGLARLPLGGGPPRKLAFWQVAGTGMGAFGDRAAVLAGSAGPEWLPLGGRGVSRRVWRDRGPEGSGRLVIWLISTGAVLRSCSGPCPGCRRLVFVMLVYRNHIILARQ